VVGDDLYMLRGWSSRYLHVSISLVPPAAAGTAPRLDNYLAHRDLDFFGMAHFTQMAMTRPRTPLSFIGFCSQSVFRFSRVPLIQSRVTGYTRSQSIPAGTKRAMAVSPIMCCISAIGDRSFATNFPNLSRTDTAFSFQRPTMTFFNSFFPRRKPALDSRHRLVASLLMVQAVPPPEVTSLRTLVIVYDPVADADQARLSSFALEPSESCQGSDNISKPVVGWRVIRSYNASMWTPSCQSGHLSLRCTCI
jgi:hypothetical protein